MKYKIILKNRKLKGTIRIPSSKSISNRLLIIRKICPDLSIINISQSDDTKIMDECLKSNNDIINVGDAGTAMRFLTAYYASIPCIKTIGGNPRLNKRPIGPLVSALRTMGADIRYLDKEGYPPLKIIGKELNSPVLEIDGSISSQYITALMLIAPTLKNSLIIKINGKLVSKPYVDMTLKLLNRFDIDTKFEDSEITILNNGYKIPDWKDEPIIEIEGDWSSSSYWYGIALGADDLDLTIQGINTDSIQGDRLIYILSEIFGIRTNQIDSSHIQLTKSNLKPSIECLELDCSEIPDLVPILVSMCVIKRVGFMFEGLETLKIKESDRIESLQKEFAKVGVYIKNKDSTIYWDGLYYQSQPEPIIFNTHNDHRIAMSLVPLVYIFDEIWIEDPMVTTKSYPFFWEDMKKIGIFNIPKIVK